MLRRKDKDAAVAEPAGEEPTDGIVAAGNRLGIPWLISTLLILLALLASFAYLLLLRDAGLQREQVTRAARSHAVQQAANIEQRLIHYQERLQAAASTPLALSAIASGREDDLALVEEAMLGYFPELASLRLIALGDMGTATLSAADVGLRNHIEMDLLRRTFDGETATPESYKFEGKWLTSLAQMVQHPRLPSKRAVILGSLDNQIFVDSMASMGAELGRSTLEQEVQAGKKKRTSEIAKAGKGGAQEFAAEAQLNADTWTVRFTPSSQMLSLYQLDNRPLLIAGGGLIFILLLCMLLLRAMTAKVLKSEVEKIMGESVRQGALDIGVPALVPLARQMRHISQRQADRPPPPTSAGVSDRLVRAAAGVSDDDEDEERSPRSTSGPIKVPDHIFRAYDIRGIVDEELTEPLVYRLGRALGTMAGEAEQQALIVGSDGRLSSPAIKNLFVKGLLDSGRDVMDIGMVPTPVLYYATETTGTTCGVMVTASHNPAEYNGFKIVFEGRPLAGEALQELKERLKKGGYSEGAGRLAKQDVKKEYIQAVVDDIAISNPLKIVVDAGNGVAGDLAPRVLGNLGCEVVRLYCDIDGNFPHHHPDPGVDDNLYELRKKVSAVGAHFGVAFDGDGDRLTIISERGEIIRNDKLLMLLADDIVVRNPGTDVVFDVKCSSHLTQLVSKQGGSPILWKTGHALMREKMLETGALLGGEFSGHIYIGERWFNFDDALYATSRLAEIISATGLNLSELLEDFPSTESTPEIKVAVEESEKFDIMERFAENAEFEGGVVNDLDGIRVDYTDGWGLLRASNTTPNLTARFEARDVDALARIQEEFRIQLESVEPDLEIRF